MHMTKTIKIDFFLTSRKWFRRSPKIKQITFKIKKLMKIYFNKKYSYNLNIILCNKTRMIAANYKFNKKRTDTDVLTFVNKISNKNLGKIIYCDIFFSIDTIEKFVVKNKINFYDHFSHLLIHSMLHINNYRHKSIQQFEKMKKEEIKILKAVGIGDPYIY